MTYVSSRSIIPLQSKARFRKLEEQEAKLAQLGAEAEDAASRSVGTAALAAEAETAAERYEKKITILRDALAAAEAETQGRSAALDEATAETARLRGHTADLEARLARCEAELGAGAASSSAMLEEAQAEAERRVVLAETQRHTLEAQCEAHEAELTVQAGRVRELEREVMTAGNERIAEAVATAERAAEIRYRGSQDEISRLEAERTRLLEREASLAAEVDASNRATADAEAAAAEHRETAGRLQHKVAMLEAAAASTSTKVVIGDADDTTVQSESVALLEARIVELEGEVTRERNAGATLVAAARNDHATAKAEHAAAAAAAEKNSTSLREAELEVSKYSTQLEEASCRIVELSAAIESRTKERDAELARRRTVCFLLPSHSSLLLRHVPLMLP